MSESENSNDSGVSAATTRPKVVTIDFEGVDEDVLLSTGNAPPPATGCGLPVYMGAAP